MFGILGALGPYCRVLKGSTERALQIIGILGALLAGDLLIASVFNGK